MSQKYRVTNNEGHKNFGLEIGDIVTKVEGSKRNNLYELPKHLHGKGHTAFYPDGDLNLKESNYLYIEEKDLEEINENEKGKEENKMSKSIYEEAIIKVKEIAEVNAATSKQWLEFTINIELINNQLQQAQKQEKLLNQIKGIIDREIEAKFSHDTHFEPLKEELIKRYSEIKELMKELKNETN